MGKNDSDRLVEERFCVFGAVAFASIRELPNSLQDRSVVIQLQRALVREIPEHLEDGSSPELVQLKRELATWANASKSCRALFSPTSCGARPAVRVIIGDG